MNGPRRPGPVKVTVTTRDGAVKAIDGLAGLSLMQGIRNARIDELQAICGGSLSCGTCHVYLDSVPAGVELPDRSEDEQDLLDASDHHQPNSRLACQLTLGPALDGIGVTIAPED